MTAGSSHALIVEPFTRLNSAIDDVIQKRALIVAYGASANALA
jgi:hypothetical protein